MTLGEFVGTLDTNSSNQNIFNVYVDGKISIENYTQDMIFRGLIYSGDFRIKCKVMRWDVTFDKVCDKKYFYVHVVTD